MQITENWQKRFESDIHEKSPFYRALNGDWRENDKFSKTNVIEVEDKKADFKSVSSDIKSQIISRGNVVNNDTSWTIQVSRRGLEDSLTYARKHNNNAVYNMLYNVNDIIKNGILLDSVISEKNNKNKANNTAFMHKMYSVCKFNNEAYLAKLTVEEFADGRQGTLKRLYNIQDIKIEPLRHAAFTDNQLALSVLNGTEISIADLFQIVKASDKNFYLNVRESEHEKIKSHSQLTEHEQAIFEEFKADNPNRAFAEVKKPAVTLMSDESKIEDTIANALKKFRENHSDLSPAAAKFLERAELQMKANNFSSFSDVVESEIARHNYGLPERINRVVFDGKLDEVTKEINGYLNNESAENETAKETQKPLISGESNVSESPQKENFENPSQTMEQLSLLDNPVIYEPDLEEKAIRSVLMYGSGFENGKFRIEKFCKENHSINEFADMLKKEYGIGGHSGNEFYSFTNHDSKGIEIILNRKYDNEEGRKIHITWKEAAKRISELVSKGEYNANNDITFQIPDNHSNLTDYHIQESDLSAAGKKAQFKRNIEAIKLIKDLEEKNAAAITSEEQKTLSLYAGWGGIQEAFDPNKSSWSDEYSQLKNLLTEDEYASARASVLDSFYTPPFIIDSIYKALENMGFQGGTILEIIIPSLIQSRGIIKKCALAV